MSGWWVYVVSLFLLFGNAFFVGAEFAAMAVRRSALEPLANAGSTRAATSMEALERLGSMLATAQLGITVCSVGLGALAEAALHHLLEPVFAAWGMGTAWAGGVALAIALLIGWRTRPASLLSWFLLISLLARNPLIVGEGDRLLALLLLWAGFLPLGRHFSVDAITRGPHPPRTADPAASWALRSDSSVCTGPTMTADIGTSSDTPASATRSST